MTDENRAELRQVITNLVGIVDELSRDGKGPPMCWGSSEWATGFGGMTLASFCDPRSRRFESLPPLTTAQQLALSVLLGDDIPLGVLLSACEDAGVFADGLAGEIAEKARAEERERCAIAAMMLTLTRADELRAGLHNPLYSTEAATLDDHAAWLRDRMMERA